MAGARLACGAGILILSAAPLAAQSAPPDSAATAAPVYAAEQASGGAATYQAFCISCHDDGYHTAPKFRQKWSGRSVYELFTTLRATMPDDNPGGLSNDDYIRVLAYILKQNGVQPGMDSLAVDSVRMAHMRLTLPDSSR
jgi:mono/diheme cytochrome c family protein